MGKASREKRERRAGQSDALAALDARLESNLGANSKSTTGDIKNHRRSGPDVSDSLATLLQPYIAAAMDAETRHNLTRAAIMAWNSCTPGGIPAHQLQNYIQSPDPQARDEMLNIIHEMRQRKLRLFPNDHRVLLDAELREQNNGTFYLAVTLFNEVQEDEAGTA